MNTPTPTGALAPGAEPMNRSLYERELALVRACAQDCRDRIARGEPSGNYYGHSNETLLGWYREEEQRLLQILE